LEFCCKQKSPAQEVVVGVNTDRSIQELKGNNRPILSLEDRVGVLRAIQWIDYIITFDTKSVFPLIEELRPKIIVKGGNYSKKACAEADRIIGEDFVNSYGGKVLVAPFVVGISTTEIIRRIMVPIRIKQTGRK
jgi:D-beta-D-heptose 7-phosphate kinase/D-beta-D-heptose 1-phosphate adenosyltransferase